MATPATLLMIALISVATSTHACIHEFGTIAEAAALAGSHYTYGYNGLDWPNTFKECRGTRQSPVLLPGSGAAAQALGQPDAKSNFSYGTLSNAKVVNNGRTLQVSLPADFTSDVKIPIKGAASNATHLSVLNGEGEVSYVKATPAQFHFHSTSEHVMSGADYPLEMHIVHFVKKDQLAACEDPGCPLVLGIFMSLTLKEDEVKPELRKLIEAMPFHEGRTANVSGDLDVGALLPEERSYFTYEGSLTTPPCTEGILWHVLTTPIKISRSLLTKYKEAVGDLYCQEEDAKKEEDGKKDAERDNDTKLVNGTYFRLPPANKDGCVKLANGNNYREVQPINGRPIKLAT